MEHVLLPLAAYLFVGGMVLELCDFSIDKIYFAVWGIMAALILGIKEYFANKITIVVMALYTVLLVIWLSVLGGEKGRLHAAMMVTGLCGVILFRVIFREKLIRAIYGCAVLVLLVGMELSDISFSKWIIALAIILFLNSVSEALSFFYSGKARSFLAIYIMVAAITMLTPAPDEAYDWRFVTAAVDSLRNFIEHTIYEINYYVSNLGSDGVFHYGYTGYQDSSISLFVSLEDQNKLQFYVRGNRTRRNLYLRGTVCDSYADGVWAANTEEETMSYQTDTLMTLYSIFSNVQEKSELDRFMEVKEQEIVVQNISTHSLFFPLKLLDTTKTDIHTAGDNLRMTERSASGDEYTYRFLDFDYANPELMEILRSGNEIEYNEETYELIYTKMKKYYGIELEKMPFDEFLEAVSGGEKRIADRYTDPGASVSERVRLLAEDIIRGCDNDYEKCRALEEYLYQYSYNKSVRMPKDADILDWFFFEGREGYCIHYATALVSMLRCEGIPARLAEGFLVDYKNSEPVSGFPVSDKNAHAWAEAYIEGFGWIRLEPTVVNVAAADSVWYQENDTEDNAEDNGTEFHGDIREETEETANDSETEAEGENSQTAPESGPENILPLVIRIIPGLAVSIMLIVIVQLIYRRIAIRKSNNPDVLLRHFLMILGNKYSPQRTDETVREYFERIYREDRISDKEKGKLAAILKISEEYWYSTESIGGEDIRMIKEICEDFRGSDFGHRTASIGRR